MTKKTDYLIDAGLKKRRILTDFTNNYELANKKIEKPILEKKKKKQKRQLDNRLLGSKYLKLKKLSQHSFFLRFNRWRCVETDTGKNHMFFLFLHFQS